MFRQKILDTHLISNNEIAFDETQKIKSYALIVETHDIIYLQYYCRIISGHF